MLDKLSKTNIIVRERYGWKKSCLDGCVVWFKGTLLVDMGANSFISSLISSICNCEEPEKQKALLNQARGNFSMIISGPSWSFAAVDKIRSGGIFFSYSMGGIISNQAADIIDIISDNDIHWDNRSLQSFSMSGYTIGRKTLVDNVYQLAAGEYLLTNNNKIQCFVYYIYRPWNIVSRSIQDLQKNLTEVHLAVLEDIIDEAKGRQIVVPLSAGNDSRLIVSGLKKLGAKNVVCFSYGRHGNFEAQISRSIAERLGYLWLFVPVTISSQKRFFKSSVYSQYLSDFDTYASVPAVQDVSEVFYLYENKLISSDAIFINGNSGDFISGGHIPFNTQLPQYLGKDIDVFLLNSFYEKHYSLWSCLKTDKSKASIVADINKLIDSKNIPRNMPAEVAHGLFESIEYLGRQTMYVVNQQHSYEFSGYEWRLPLWDNLVMDFWETVPVELKFNQYLYKKTLVENNWGNVWIDFPINNKLIRPYWLRYLRLVSKILVSPMGKNKWHSIEKNMFTYWMDVSCNSAVSPYLKSVLDRRGQRHFVSWLVDNYMIDHGLGSVCDKHL